jgi:outer membrane receptor for ferrienterochelin and colicin
MKNAVCLACVILLCCCAGSLWTEPAPAHAEDSFASAESHDTDSVSEDQPPEIEVEVVGRKWGEQVVPALTPSTGEIVSVISASEIENLGQETVADTIEFLPGVQVVRQGRKFERLIFVRGGFVPTVLLDGVQVSTASGGFVSGFANRALYSIPISAIERIEVIRSSSSLIYGPQALSGGVINLVTKSGSKPARLVLDAEVGSYDAFRQTLSHFDAVEGRSTAFVAEREINDTNLLFGGQRMDHIFFKTNRSYENGNTVKFFLLSNEGSRRLDSWSEEFQDAVSRGPVYWEFDPWREHFSSLSFSRNLPAEGAGMDLVLWARQRAYRNLYWAGPTSPRPGSTVYNDIQDDALGASFFWRQPVGERHFLRLGSQWYRLNGFEQDVVLNRDTLQPTLAPQTTTDYELTSYFVQDEWTLSPDMRLFWGGRYETPDDRDDALVYSLGVERDVTPDTAISLRCGTGVGFPTVGQLDSDPTLKDKESVNVDLGVDHHFSDSLLGRLAYFRIAIENDFIDYLRPGGDPTNSSDYLTAQADQTTYGYEAELQGGSPALQWHVNWTHLNRDVDRTPEIGDQPIQLAIPPDDMFNFGVRWNPTDRTRLSVTHRSVSDYLARARYFSGAWEIDAYNVSNATLRHELGKGWAVYGMLGNIFDEDYSTQPGYPMPGRNYSVGLTRTVEWN